MTIPKTTTPTIIKVGFFLLTASPACQAQGEAAFPFLQISPAPDGNAWGGVSTAVPSDNSIATAVNPGQLGLFSLRNRVGVSSYTSKTNWLPAFQQADLAYNAWGLSAGLNLDDHLCLPFSASFGVGYSRIDLNLGTFIRTGSGGPDPIGTFEASEFARNITLGIGFEYLVRLGMGWNFKDVTSMLGPISGSSEPNEANASMTDFGLILQIPIVRIAEAAKAETLSVLRNIRPLLDLNFGYSIANRGDGSVRYSGVSSTDPFPRYGIEGLSLEIGIQRNHGDQEWKILTFTLAREADQVLVTRHQDGSYEYKNGLGNISLWENVIGGKADENGVNSRKGWQINIAEMIYVRGGSYSELPAYGNRNYSTSGFAFRLSGVFKFLEAMSSESTTGTFILYVANHIDVIYDHAEYDDHQILGGTKFDALTILFR